MADMTDVSELLHAAEQVIAHIGDSKETDAELLLNLAAAIDHVRRKLILPPS